MEKIEQYLNFFINHQKFNRIDWIQTYDLVSGYVADRNKTNVIIKSNTAIDFIHGAFRSLLVSKEGFLKEFLGQQVPYVKDRYLSFEASHCFQESWLIDEEKRNALCEGVIALGYNGILLQNWSLELDYLAQFEKTVHSYGLKLGLPWMESLPPCELVLYKKSMFPEISRKLCDQGYLKSEIHSVNIKKVRSIIDSSTLLLIELPALPNSIRSWETLFHSLPINTSIAIPLPESKSILHILRSFGDQLPIFPIFSCNCFGGGLWPILYEETNYLFNELPYDRWKGSAVLSPIFPSASSLQHCNLWTISQLLWSSSKLSSIQWMKIWFKATQNIELTEETLSFFWKLKHLTLDLQSLLYCNQMENEKERALLEACFSKVKYLFTFNDILDHFPTARYCLIDLKRYFYSLLLKKQIVLSQITDEKDFLPAGFWTKIKGSAGLSIRSGISIEILNEPLRMDPLYLEIAQGWNQTLTDLMCFSD